MSRTKKAAVASRSRAARRAAEQALLEADKSLESVPRLEDKPAVLNVHKNAGVFKKNKEKKLTRAQRRRQQKGIARAAEIIDRTEAKTQKSLARESTIQQRRADWEQVNAQRIKDGLQPLPETDAPQSTEKKDETMAALATTEEPTAPSSSGPAAASVQPPAPAEEQLDDDVDLID
ncbi:hypothetical protein KEM56_001754 [Ascosphaera pollenicola]|nr:hypothetical protein KEM56_001754 [Ascosphaera pollenicola]